jgi:hypothetical protein
MELGTTFSSPSLQDDSYSSRWILTNAYSVQVRAPYYKGLILGLEATYFSYDTKEIEYSNIDAVNYSALLGVNAFKDNKVNIFLGTEIGIQKTTLLSENLKSNLDERELYYSLIMEPQVLINKLNVFGSFKYQKVFNFRRQHILYFGAGIRFRINLSDKIQEFIK